MEYGLLIPLGKGDNLEVPYVGCSAIPNLKMRHVWSEGYAATGEHGPATYMGCCLAESHIEACERIVKNLDRKDDGSLMLSSNGLPMIWICRLFDNEEDARKSFG